MTDIDWLKVCKTIGANVTKEVMPLYKTSSGKEEIGKGAGGDMTIKADKVAEDIVVKELENLDTCISLISEERGKVKCGKNGEPAYTVIVDPLDGSFNFKNGIDHFCISIAVLDMNEVPLIGYIKNIASGTEYYALRGEGAFKNGEKISVSKSDAARNILLECSPKTSGADIDFLARSFLQSRHSRALGAVALDFCLVADGTFDALLYAGASRWLDVAAGTFIVKEAGGVVSDFNGNETIMKETRLIAKNVLVCCSSEVQKKFLDRRFELSSSGNKIIHV